MISIPDAVDTTLRLIRTGLAEGVTQIVNAERQDGTTIIDKENAYLYENNRPLLQPNAARWAPDAILGMIAIKLNYFESLFSNFNERDKRRASYIVRGWLNDLIAFRNNAGHQDKYTSQQVDDFLRVAERLLTSAHAIEPARKIADIRRDFTNASLSAAPQRGIFNDEKAKLLKRIEADSAATTRGLEHPLLVPFLAWYYDREPWTQNEQAFPAAVFPLSTPTDFSFDTSVLAAWDCDRARALSDEDFAVVDRGYVSRRKETARPMRNRQTYCMQTLTIESGCPVVTGERISTYDDCLATCDSLEAELLIAFGTRPPKSPGEFVRFAESQLSLRQINTTFARERGLVPYMTGAGRSAGIAVSTLTLARKADKSFVTFLGPRSARTAVHSHLLHVAPSGMLQPILDWQQPSSKMNDEFYKVEWNVVNHVLQEISEELFGRDCEKELVDELAETPDAIFEYPEIRYLERLLQAGDAQLFVTGVVVSLLNLRPEIATCLVINDPMWYTNHSRGNDGLPKFQRNWEFKNRTELQSSDPPDFWHTPVWTPAEGDVSNRMLSEIGNVTFKNFVLPGAVALFLGLEFARTFLPTLHTK